MSEKKLHSRRKFLGQASCVGMGYVTMMNSIFNLRALNAAAISNNPFSPQTNDYKALVCIMQSGGNDSYNMLIPKSIAKYNEYAATRTNLAIPRADVLSLNAITLRKRSSTITLFPDHWDFFLTPIRFSNGRLPLKMSAPPWVGEEKLPICWAI